MNKRFPYTESILNKPNVESTGFTSGKIKYKTG